MAKRICPWWLGYFLVSPLRRLMYHPKTVLQPFVSEGMLVLEPGCGMGYFTLELARLVGPQGRVVAVDVQEKMLAGLRRRVSKAGLADRVEARLATPTSLVLDDLAGRVDFVLAFAVVHEMPDESMFYSEMRRVLRAGGKLLVVEPRGHVALAAFRASMEAACRLGFRLSDGPVIKSSWSGVLERA